MRSVPGIVLAGMLLALLSACSGSEDEAKSVAQRFWAALEEKNIEKARGYATRETAGSLNEQEDAEDQEIAVAFGDVESKDDAVMVATTLHTFDAGAEMTFEMQTVLVKEDGTWRVDVNRTMMSMFGGAMGEMMEQMGEAMQEAMQGMAEELQNGMQELSGSMQQGTGTNP